MNITKIYKKDLKLPDIYLTEAESERLERNYAKIIEKRYPNLPELSNKEFNKEKQNALNGSHSSLKKLKEYSLSLALDVVVDFYLTKNVAAYPFEDAISDAYVLVANSFEKLCVFAKNKAEFVFFLQSRFMRDFNAHLIDYISSNLDLSKSIFGGSKIVNNPADEISENTSAEHSMLKMDLKDIVLERLETLTPRESKVLKMYFGLSEENSKPMDKYEIAKICGVTSKRIEQVKNKALRRMRHPSRSDYFKDYADGI